MSGAVEMVGELLAPSLFVVAADIAADPHVVPDNPGIYGWWFDEDVLAQVPKTDSLRCDGRRLLYVGIAPSAPSALGRASRRTLRDRLKNHARGPIAHSTLRRTLTVLLDSTLVLAPTRRANGKLTMSHEAELELTAWMSSHARVSWMVHQSPWLVEHQLITQGPRLPLNIRDSPDPFRHELARLRRNAGR